MVVRGLKRGKRWVCDMRGGQGQGPTHFALKPSTPIIVCQVCVLCFWGRGAIAYMCKLASQQAEWVSLLQRAFNVPWTCHYVWGSALPVLEHTDLRTICLLHLLLGFPHEL